MRGIKSRKKLKESANTVLIGAKKTGPGSQLQGVGVEHRKMKSSFRETFPMEGRYCDEEERIQP